MSEIDSHKNPITNMTVPAISKFVIGVGLYFALLTCLGELMKITGRLTVKTHTA